MALRADGVGLGEPVRDLVVDLLDALDPEGVQVVAGRRTRSAGSAGPAAGEHDVAVDPRAPRLQAAKLIRTWSAIRVFSGRTVTGPLRSASAITRSTISRMCGGLPAKCSSSSRSSAQVWV